MPLSIINIVMPVVAGICLAIGCMHFIIWRKQHRRHAHLALAIFSLSVAALTLGELLLMKSQSTHAYGEISRWMHVPIFFIVTSILVFVRSYFGTGRMWLAYVAFSLRLLALILNFYFYPTINYVAITSLETVMLPWGEPVAVAVGVRNPWSIVAELGMLALLLFLLDACIACARKADRGEKGRDERRRVSIVGGGLLLSVSLLFLHSFLIHTGFVHLPYGFGIFMLVSVLITSYQLSGAALRTMQLVGQLQQAESDLLRNQKRMDQVSEAAEVGMWEWDVASDEIWLSEQARRHYGNVPSERISFEQYLQALHPEDRDKVHREIMESVGNGSRFQREYRVVSAGGAENWVMTRGNVETKERGQLILRGISLDISTRKMADERFRQVVDAAPNGMLLTDVDGRISLVNAQLQKDFGYSREELIGQPVEMLIPASLRESHLGFRSEFVHNSSSRPMALNREVYGRCKDGREIPLEIRLSPIRNGSGVEVLASVIDISERRQRDDELRREREFLRQIIDINPNLIFVKDREGRFTLANRVVADIYGTTADNLVGRTDADFNPSAEEVAGFLARDREVLDSLREYVIPEEQITDATGRVHWLQTVKRPLRNDDGGADYVLGTSTDISARKQSELELAQQRNELAHLSRAMMLSELSGSLAHELNQPLTAILSNAQAAIRFLAKDSPDLEEINEILRDIVADDKRAVEVIRGLRSMLKREGMEFAAVDPNSLVADVIRLLRSDMAGAAVTYATELTMPLPLIKGVYVQLQQILMNLIMNACDAMAENPLADRRLLISSTVGGENVMFCVSDRGQGIPTANIDRLFEPFFTTKAQGMGLGLAVCRKIIEAHGGQLWAGNNPEGGASFSFTVPVYNEAAV